MNWRHRDELGAFLNEAGLLGSGVEVGSQAGTFAAAVLAQWQGRCLTLIDPWEAQPRSVFADLTNHPGAIAADRAAAERLAAADPRVRLLRGYSPAAADHFPDHSLDFAYIDANHSYPAAAADLRAWYPKVRPGGLFAGHDYIDGVVGGCLFGVKTAVDDFALALGLAPAHTVADPPFRSWYLRKPLGPPPPPDRVTVLTAYDRAYAAVGDVAAEQGGVLPAARLPVRLPQTVRRLPPAVVARAAVIQEELAAADRVLSDADACLNASVPVTRFIRDTADVVLPATDLRINAITCWCVHRVVGHFLDCVRPVGVRGPPVLGECADPPVRRRTLRRGGGGRSRTSYSTATTGGWYCPGLRCPPGGVRRPELDAAVRSYAAMVRRPWLPPRVPEAASVPELNSVRARGTAWRLAEERGEVG